MDLLLRNSGFLRNLERVVAVFNDEKFGDGSEFPDDGAQFVGGSKCVARPLHEQYGRADAWEVF